jgi:hypothetical protein
MSGIRRFLGSRWRGPVLGVALVLAAAPSLSADGGRQRPPSDGGGPPVRVESRGGGSSSSSSPPPSSSSSGGSSRSVERRSDGDRSPRRVDRTPSSDSGRTRVESSGRSGGRYEDRRDWDRGRPTRVETDRRPSGHSYHRSGRTYYYDPYWRYRGYGGWWGGFYWPWWWYDDSYYYPHPRYRHDWRAESYQSDSGALDFDVSPERAEIYIDGRFVGIADDYDGFPEYLWLPRGTYDVVIYLEGFETIRRDFRVTPGEVIDIEDTMVPGVSVKPEPSAGRTPERREPDEDQEGAYERRPPARDEDEEDAEAYDVRGEPGRLKLEVEPGDASLYLDGRFLGTAEDLGRLRKGLILAPGKHTLQVVRPGYETLEKTFEVEPGEEVDLDLSLERE